MEFTSIAVGVFAIVGTLFFLFGREMTRRILGYLLAGLMALAVGCAWATFLFHYGWGHSIEQAMIGALGVTGMWWWLMGGSTFSTLGCLWMAATGAREKSLRNFVIPLAAMACVLTSTALEIGSMPSVAAAIHPQEGPWVDYQTPAKVPNVYDQFDSPAPKGALPSLPPGYVIDQTKPAIPPARMVTVTDQRGRTCTVDADAKGRPPLATFHSDFRCPLSLNPR